MRFNNTFSLFFCIEITNLGFVLITSANKISICYTVYPDVVYKYFDLFFFILLRDM